MPTTPRRAPQEYETDNSGNRNRVLNENGDKAKMDYGSWNWGGVTVSYHPLTEAKAQQIREMVETTTMTSSYDQDIVSEGAAPFFDGQRSAQKWRNRFRAKNPGLHFVEHTLITKRFCSEISIISA